MIWVKESSTTQQTVCTGWFKLPLLKSSMKNPCENLAVRWHYRVTKVMDTQDDAKPRQEMEFENTVTSKKVPHPI